MLGYFRWRVIGRGSRAGVRSERPESEFNSGKTPATFIAIYAIRIDSSEGNVGNVIDSRNAHACVGHATEVCMHGCELGVPGMNASL